MSKLNKFVTSQIESTTGASHETNTYSYDSNGVLVRHDADRVGKSVVGPGVLYGANKDSADQTGLNTIKLIPNEDLQSDQFLIIEPTAPNHIHIRAGGTQDDSNATLILGAERTAVTVSDNDRNVGVVTRAALISNSYANNSVISGTDFVTNSTSEIQIGYTVNVGGTDYLVDTITSIDEGVVAVTATGAVFEAETSYTFTFDPTYDNYWTFGSDGVLYGPAMGGLKVSALANQAEGDNLVIYATGANVDIQANDAAVILNGNDGEFLNDASNPDNQIATVGNVAAVTSGGATGSFTSNDGKTITVTNGIITGIA